MLPITEATYRPSSLSIYRGNPLIEALPDLLSYRTASIRQMLRKEPEMPHPQANRRQRCAWLMSLNKELFIELPRHMHLQEMVDMIIRQGYQHRNPIGAERAAAIQAAYERMQKGDATAMINFGVTVQDPLSLSVIGCSGIGKTTAVMRVLSLYPQVVHHKAGRLGAETLQVTFLKIECPHDGSVKSLCTNVIRELDRVTGQDYEAAYVKSRSTLETLKSQMIHLLTVHYVGLLVIDEIQNLTVSKKNKEQLFNFIVSLANTLAVPILYAGTPKILEFMSSDLRVARRFGSFGTIRWNHLSQGSAEWKSLIVELWKFNVLDQSGAEIPPTIEASLYKHSQGIIDVLIKLFILSQMDALVRNLKELDPERIHAVYETYFQSVDPMIRALKNNDALALEKYQDIAFVGEEFAAAEQQLQEALIAATAEYRDADAGEPNVYVELLRRLGVKITPEIESSLRDPEKDPGDVLLEAVKKQVDNPPRALTTELKAKKGNLV